MQTPRIKFNLLLLLLAFSIVRPSCAQEVGKAATNHHSLWKVEGKSKVVYLLGSTDLLKPADFPLATPIEMAFTNAQIAVFETDIDKMAQPEIQQKILSGIRLPDGESLKQQLSAEVYEAFSKKAEENGLPIEVCNSFKPSGAGIILEVAEMRKLGLDSEHGMNQYFFHRASKEAKQVVALETVDFQIGMITEFSKEEGELLLKSMLKEIDEIKKSYAEMVAAWKTGDAVKLDKVLNDTMREVPTVYKRMVTDRSQSWVPKIEELLRGDKNAIVIVGTDHLVGKDGMLELLKKKGFKITQL